MMRPAVCSPHSSRLDLAGLPAPHQVQHLLRQFLREVIDQRRRVVVGELVQELGDLLGRPAGEQLRRCRLWPISLMVSIASLGWRSTRSANTAERSVSSRAPEDLGEVGRMLLRADSCRFASAFGRKAGVDDRDDITGAP
ncbi:MAG: hypothetical protein R2712_04795 [Vicinamibacterales bacterium]